MEHNINQSTTAISAPALAGHIVVVRGQRVLLDSDLADLYAVETKRLNEQVKRNMGRFPSDFMFQLTSDEFENLKSHFATSSWGGRRKLPLAFTEHGAIMAASVLNSDRAVQMSVYVVRAFVRLRERVASNQQLSQRLDELERCLNHKLATHDETIAELIKALRQLMTTEAPPGRPIGFIHPQK